MSSHNIPEEEKQLQLARYGAGRYGASLFGDLSSGTIIFLVILVIVVIIIVVGVIVAIFLAMRAAKGVTAVAKEAGIVDAAKQVITSGGQAFGQSLSGLGTAGGQALGQALTQGLGKLLAR